MQTTLEQLSDTDLQQALELTELSLKALGENQRLRTARLKDRLAKAFEKKLHEVYSQWHDDVMSKSQRLNLEGLSLTAEIVRNFELALDDLPRWNRLRKLYHNEPPRTKAWLRERYEARIQGLASLSRKQKKKLIERLGEIASTKQRHPGALAPVVAVSVSPGPLEEMVAEQFELGVVEGGALTYKELGEKAALFSLRNPRTINWIEEQSFLYAEHTASKYTGQLHWEVIKKGLDEGLSTRQIRQYLDGQFDIFERRDAERIVRTATAQAIEAGRSDALEEVGIESVDIVNGPNPCDDCVDLANGGPYTVQEARGLLPVHPYCQCEQVARMSPVGAMV